VSATHESVREHAVVTTASNRAFGLTVGGILLAIGLLRAGLAEAGLDGLAALLLLAGGLLAALGQLRPDLLAGANRLWTRLGLLLAKLVNPIILMLVFVTTILPIGLLRRTFGKTPVATRPEPERASYWQDRPPVRPTLQSLRDQF